MISDNTTSWPSRIALFFCSSFLILALFSETYTVLAIALDKFLPAWYRTLGWLLLVMPIGLAGGLLLTYAKYRRLAFFLSTTSLSLYAMLVVLDTSRTHSGGNDWIFAAGWIVFCVLGIAAAKFLTRPLSENRADV